MKEIHIGGDKDGKNEETPVSMHQQEINTLKIDKLSNRVTIISIIIPCIIGAIILFAYLDMQEKVGDVNKEKQSQVEQLGKQLEERANALEVKIADIKFTLEKKLPGLEDQVSSLSSSLTKLGSTKADRESMQTAVAKLEKAIRNNAEKHDALFNTVERSQKEALSAIEDTKTRLNKKIDELDIEIHSKLEKIPDLKQRFSDIGEKLGRLEKKAASVEKLEDTVQKMDSAIRDLDKNLRTIQDRLSRIETQVEKRLENSDAQTAGPDKIETKTSRKQSSVKTPEQEKQVQSPEQQETAKPDPPDTELEEIEPGTIIEQDISE